MHVFEFRALRWQGQPNATTSCTGNCTLAGMPVASDFQGGPTGHGTTATTTNMTATGSNATLPLPQRISGLVFSGHLYMQYLIDAARSSDWFGKQCGAMTVEDVTDVPAYAALKLTSPAISARNAWAISWRDIIEPLTGTGEPMIGECNAPPSTSQATPGTHGRWIVQKQHILHACVSGAHPCLKHGAFTPVRIRPW